MQTLIVKQTNIYVTELSMRERPARIAERYPWPPVWTEGWEPMTEEKSWQYLALLLYIAQHKTGSERELWSKGWFHRRHGIHKIMTYNEFARIKAALHFQADNEPRESEDGKLLFIKKIGILME